MIDEKKLVEEIKKMFRPLTTADGSAEVDVCIHSYDEALYDVLNVIQELPREDEWISVEERMPNYLQKVLVTYIGYFDGKRHCDDVAYREFSGQWMWALDDTRVGVEIIAWMPLPEPYQGEEK